MVDEFLRTIPIFRDLSDEVTEQVEKVLSLRKYPKRSMIIIEEEYGDIVYFIKSGTVKITRLNEEGKEVILALLGTGEFFGEMAILDGEARSANAMAQEDCEVYAMSQSNFVELLKKNFKITYLLLGELARRIRKSDQQIEALSLSDAEHRIGVSILSLAEDRGVIRNGRVTIPNLPYQQDIASMAGTSRETVSRVFKILEERHVLLKDGHTLIIPDYLYFRKAFGKKFS
ncbi:MAG: Crp/Fnr family transcriptional regulator [Candidatus Marinimicrobia bacterium]|nr:Crp/Fnr family transcriptional regulator [Candidatus Neomarinimicrobiota bacterium]MBL7022666.1 Crp/Fnr family transcriptional regulator [Candidatus Neomarinimicrobiota bacterium]MBL7109940.1 Crp/Fnr family transcriptional regulator [Candidatus Neomarinimicrobiota bacterium]